MADRFSFEQVSDERTARQILACVVPPEDEVTQHLLRRFNAVEVLQLAVSDDRLSGIDQPRALLWRRRFDTANPNVIRESFARNLEAGCGVLIPGDKDWPKIVDEVEPSPPYALWTKGDTSLLSSKTWSRIAMLGAETPSDYGSWWASTVSEDLAVEGLTIAAIAGQGIPADAVQAALDADGTPVVVAPHALDTQGEALASLSDAVAAKGLLISEWPPGIEAGKDAVEKAHRILTALSGTTVVVETGDYSAPMESARRARSLGADVFAVPGDVTREHIGANLLIAEQTADLVVDVEDIKAALHTKVNLDLFPPSQSAHKTQSRPTERPHLGR